MSDYHLNVPFMKNAHVIPDPAFQVRALAPHKKEFEILFPGQSCFYCGDAAQSVDHKIPRSKGGLRGDNLVPACHPCNQMKGSLTVEEFAARMRRILGTLAARNVIQFGEELKWPVAA